MTTHPITPHDAVSQAIVSPHVRDHRPELFISRSTILPLHPDLEHFDLKVSAVGQEETHGRGQDGVGGSSHSSSERDLANREIRVRRHEPSRCAVCSEEKRVDSGYADQR